MKNSAKIISLNPPSAVPGGEIFIECEGFQAAYEIDSGVYFGGLKGRIVSASPRRVVTIVPEDFVSGETEVYLEINGERSEAKTLLIAERIAEDLHIVSNPAVNPADDSIILTRSGGRGQELPVTLFRFEKFGRLEEIPVKVMNPTGLAFDREGKFFATNRADGEVLQIVGGGKAAIYASNLGIATGIAFNGKGEMFIGDRTGNIFRVGDLGETEIFAVLEPSVSAFHLAFDSQDNLYVAAPSLSGFEGIKKIDSFGNVSVFAKGFGRPQGLAFDQAGNLYCATSFRGRSGIVKISPNGEKIENFVAASAPVGLCFTRNGEMIIATGEEVFSLPVGIYGTLLT